MNKPVIGERYTTRQRNAAALELLDQWRARWHHDKIFWPLTWKRNIRLMDKVVKRMGLEMQREAV